MARWEIEYDEIWEGDEYIATVDFGHKVSFEKMHEVMNLIEAAPELLEALMSVRGLVERMSPGETLQHLDDAIAKAEGRS